MALITQMSIVNSALSAYSAGKFMDRKTQKRRLRQWLATDDTD